MSTFRLSATRCPAQAVASSVTARPKASPTFFKTSSSFQYLVVCNTIINS
ncbi:hypothetical protein HanXRQr2_Chr10g0442841 [Helianthus annuus]|uniref:Uncharacterized protein n=1 Tax=Helianthus annuus TaxID=4232 RepID=A0A9K3HY54_HELAN|nr:hypothetical protein HanXRQr2_Chr10g0442841 [Helianthus annuus]